MNTTPFVIERIYNASPERVWQALTDKKQIKEWSFDVDDFKPQVGFEFSFEGGKNGNIFVHRCKVTEVVPGKKLSYTWRYENVPGNSEVTIELFPEGKQTRLKLTHTGLESFPQDENFAQGNFAQGWTQIVGTLLKEYVEKNASA